MAIKRHIANGVGLLRRFRELIQQASIYTISNFVNIAIPVILLPVLTRYLSPEDYGIVATFQTMKGIAVLVVGMGIGSSIFRAYYDKGEGGFDFGEHLFNALAVVGVLFVVVTAATLLGSALIEEYVRFPARWMLLVPLISISSTISAIVLKLWIADRRAVPVAILSIGKIAINVMLSIYLVVAFDMLWQGRILGIGVAEVAGLVVGGWLLMRGYPMVHSINLGYIKRVMLYSAPVFFHSLGFWSVGSVDRLFLNNIVGLSSTGTYSVGCSISSVIPFLAASLGMAWSPLVYDRLSRPNPQSKIKIVRTTYLFFAAFVLAGAALLLTAPYLLKVLVGEEFYGAISFLTWLVPGFVFHAMYRIVSDYIFYSKKTYIMMNITLFSAAVNLVLNFILIRANGAIGAAQAAFFSYLLIFALTWWYGNKLCPMPWLSSLRFRTG